MNRLLTLLFFIFCFHVHAQPEPAMLSLKGYGGDKNDQVASNVTQTSDGGFIILMASGSSIGSGNIDSFCSAGGSNNAIFLKFNSDASNVIWTKCTNSGRYIFPKDNGDFVFGAVLNIGNWAYGISREDALGNVLWSKAYGKDASSIMRSMLATDDGGYIMLGETNYTDTTFTTHYGSWMDADLAIIRVDSNGKKVWSKVIGGTGHDYASALVKAPGDGCYIVGGTGSYDHDCTGNHGGNEVYLARLDKDGNILWHDDLGGSAHDGGINACSNDKGGVIIAARTSSTDGDVHNFTSGTEYWAVEVDSSDNITWDNCFANGSYSIPLSICKGADNSIWINGFTSGADDDVWLVHADGTGNLINSKTLGSNRQDRGQMVYPAE